MFTALPIGDGHLPKSAQIYNNIKEKRDRVDLYSKPYFMVFLGWFFVRIEIINFIL